jgi:hypothetical protein
VQLELAADADAVAALTALMARPPSGQGADRRATRGRRFTAAEILCYVEAAVLRATTGAAAPAGRRDPFCATIVRSGGVPLAVDLLREMLEGGRASDPPPPWAESLVLASSISNFCTGDAAALRAARDAGALPLVVRSLVEAAKDPNPGHMAILANAIHFLNELATVGPAGCLRALASQPALVGALAAALGLAARAGRGGGAAAGGGSDFKVQSLTRFTLESLLTLLLHGSPARARAAASAFVQAGGAAHLVRAPAAMPGCVCLLRVLRGACPCIAQRACRRARARARAPARAWPPT